MKKVIVLLGCLAFLICACDNKKSEEKQTNKQTEKVIQESSAEMNVSSELW